MSIKERLVKRYISRYDTIKHNLHQQMLDVASKGNKTMEICALTDLQMEILTEDGFQYDSVPLKPNTWVITLIED